LGPPRLTMHLKGDVVNPRLVITKTGEDHTERMVKWAKKIERTCHGGPLWLKSMVARHTNVMIHMLGYSQKDLTGDEKQEMLEIIKAYRGELVPIVVPLTLFFHYVQNYDQPYLREQTHLNPHPTALKLRNHA
jgi:hypothetical protein